MERIGEEQIAVLVERERVRHARDLTEADDVVAAVRVQHGARGGCADARDDRDRFHRRRRIEIRRDAPNSRPTDGEVIDAADVYLVVARIESEPEERCDAGKIITRDKLSVPVVAQYRVGDAAVERRDVNVAVRRIRGDAFGKTQVRRERGKPVRRVGIDDRVVGRQRGDAWREQRPEGSGNNSELRETRECGLHSLLLSGETAVYGWCLVRRPSGPRCGFVGL